MRLACLALLVGCAADPKGELEVTSPTDGAIITTQGSLVFMLHGRNLREGIGAVDVTVDSSLDTSFTGGVPSGGCDDCMFAQTWAGAAVANGTHTITFDLIYDLTTVAAAEVTVTLMHP